MNRLKRVERLYSINKSVPNGFRKMAQQNFDIDSFVVSELTSLGMDDLGDYDLQQIKSSIYNAVISFTSNMSFENMRTLFYLSEINEDPIELIKRFIKVIIREYFSGNTPIDRAVEYFRDRFGWLRLNSDRNLRFTKYPITNLIEGFLGYKNLDEILNILKYLRRQNDEELWRYLYDNSGCNFSQNPIYVQFPDLFDTILLPVKDKILDRSIGVLSCYDKDKLSKIIGSKLGTSEESDSNSIALKDGSKIIINDLFSFDFFEDSGLLFDQINLAMAPFRNEYINNIEEVLKVSCNNIAKKLDEKYRKIEKAYQLPSKITIEEMEEVIFKKLSEYIPKDYMLFQPPLFGLRVHILYGDIESYKSDLLSRGISSIDIRDFYREFSSIIIERIKSDENYLFEDMKSIFLIDLKPYYTNNFDLAALFDDSDGSQLSKPLLDINEKFYERIISTSDISDTVAKNMLADGSLEKLYKELSSGGVSSVEIDVRKYLSDDQIKNIIVKNQVGNGFVGRESKIKYVEKSLKALKESILNYSTRVEASDSLPNFEDPLRLYAGGDMPGDDRAAKEERINSFIETLRGLLVNQINKEESYLSGRPTSGNMMMMEFSKSGKNIISSALNININRSDIFDNTIQIDWGDASAGGFDLLESIESLDDNFENDNQKKESTNLMSIEDFKTKLISVISNKFSNSKPEVLTIAPLNTMIISAINFVTHQSRDYFDLFPSEAASFFRVTKKNEGSLYNNLRDILSFYGDNRPKIKSIQEANNKNIVLMKDPRPSEDGRDSYIELSSQIYSPSFWEGTGVKTRNEILDAISKVSTFGNPLDIIKIRIAQSKDKSVKPKSKADYINTLSKIMEILHTYRFDSKLLNSNYLLKAGDKTVEIALKAAFNFGNIVKIESDLNDFIETLNKILADNRRAIIPNEASLDKFNYFIETIKKGVFKNAIDFDNFIRAILSKPDFYRFFQSTVAIVSDYESFSNWYKVAEKKEDAVFSPNMTTDDYRFRVLGDLDPYHFRVGGDTNCCQIIGGFGEQAAIDSFINPKAGVVLLEAKKNGEWKLVSQSYFHVFESQNSKGVLVKGILLDNIEAGGLGESVFKAIPEAYAALGLHLRKQGFRIVGCGIEYTRVISNAHFEYGSLRSDPRTFKASEITGKNPYTDFNSSQFLNLLSPKFNFSMPNIIPSESFSLPKESAQMMAFFKRAFLIGEDESSYDYLDYKLSRLARALSSIGMNRESSIISSLF